MLSGATLQEIVERGEFDDADNYAEKSAVARGNLFDRPNCQVPVTVL